VSWLGSAPAGAQLGEFLSGRVEAFEASDIRFPASASNAPFFPVAYVSGSFYNEAEVDVSGDEELGYEINAFSQAAGVPFFPTSRDALAVGQYLSRTEFNASDPGLGDFSVNSVGVPLGWLRQLEGEWQAAAFAMPLAHQASLRGSHWSWQYRAGIFGLNTRRRDLIWACGLYLDVNDAEDFVLPYLGASWEIDEYWTLSAVLPWPALSYAPNRDWFVSIGASPSGASWSVESDGDEVAANFDAWDFGVSVERRLSGPVWGAVGAGVGGFRGLRFTVDGVESPEVDIESSGYVSLGVNFRPEVD